MNTAPSLPDDISPTFDKVYSEYKQVQKRRPTSGGSLFAWGAGLAFLGYLFFVATVGIVAGG